MSGPLETVCVFAPTADGGHARYAWELCTALANHPRADTRIELVSTRDLDGQFRTDAYAVHPVLPPLHNRGEFRTQIGWMANRLLYYPVRESRFLSWLAARPDVTAVHFQEWKPWLAPWVLRRIRAMGKRSFYTVHNVLPHRYPPGVPKWLMHHWVRRACRLCDGLFVHTERLADELHRFLAGNHAPIAVVPHGVWTVPAERQGPPLSERLRRKRLLLFGAIRRNKGIDMLLRAAAHLPGYRITIAGEPIERPYFDSEVVPRVKSLRAAGVDVELRDRFIPDAEVAELFADHSAIVLPYTSGFVAQSGVVFMALAYGLPVVASNAGGLRDLLAEYPIGVTFDGESPEDLAAAVRKLHEEPNEESLDHGIRAARRRFTWQAAAGATLAGYSMKPQAALEADDRVFGTTAAH